MTLEQFSAALAAGEIDFEQTMAVIEANYDYREVAFRNGEQHNEAGQNGGSCKIFAFAKLQGYDEQLTLNCFGRFYRDVLATPEGDDHANIRNFINSGWQGIEFNELPLTAKG